ncbi:putative disease resistance protein At3g14460 [Vigna radiata var. radiata]|uniref:Disease resistance protein At3g14460 n=1 Tax=Vigna radiata var. radiata TaxID=3916 RepID=A0A1S3TBI6_VIGRR|nr:putative disease resistance protein At3g14460 [Vigna radiata var. radiata]
MAAELVGGALLSAFLQEIGRRIVEKCKGLPLALKTIGSLLRTKSSSSYWKSVLESDIWDLPKEVEIIPALLLSYQNLPSHLKRCFAYCALFPKDYEFDKKELILLWMAEGFLHHSKQIKNVQEIGEQYFDDLLTRSFFLQSSFIRKFVMHDLMNDLAKYVCADFCFRLKFDKGNCIPKTTRHFSFASADLRFFDDFGSLTDAKRLRSFVQITNYAIYPGFPGQFEIIRELFTKLKFLRVLSLNGYSNLKEVPDSLGDLKHLHSLDLSHTNIEKLPDSIGLLYNLLILRLNYCSCLKELPSSLHKLSKLRCLEFEHTEVTKMPMHFGELKNLHVLDMFCVSRNSEFSTKQLGGLNLHGSLSINEVQNIVNPLDALEAKLKNKHLVELKLIWNSNHIPDDPRKEKEVLENLQPSNKLEHFSIKGYCGTQFPSWVFDNSLSNLVSLQLKDCKYCLCLPPLGLLSSLETIEIRGFDGIVSIGAEFYGSNSSSFKSLEILKFYNMKEWEEWECKTTSFPRLQRLFVVQCPKLKGLSEQLLHLKELYIESCDNLIISEHSVDASALECLKTASSPLVNIPMTHYDFIEKMTIDDGCDSLTIFQLNFFPMLRLLHLEGCQNLQRISQEHAHYNLKKMTMWKCPQFESFPSGGLSAPWLQIISIREVRNLKLLPKLMQILLPSLTELRIINCPKVEKFADGGLSSKIKDMSLSSLKLIASLRETLDVNTCLKKLSIEYLDVESFPDEVLLPPSLTSLTIIRCRNLKKLDYKLLYHLSSLELGDCPNLQCLPEEEGLPIAISSLTIWDFPLLKQRCQNPEGEDWGKIGHIEKLIIR